MIKKILLAIIRRMIWFFCFFVPIKKNRILCSSYYGRGYGDNLKYICDQLNNKNLDIIWLIKDEKESRTVPSYIKTVKNDSLKSIFYIATSKIWINNCRFSFIYKKKKQFYIQTWHGGGAQKKCEADVADKLGRAYVKMAIKDANNTDLMISDSSFMTGLYHNSFWYDGPVYECGYPRYDILLKTNKSLKKKICDFFSISDDLGIVLYAPTFRKNLSFKAYNIDFKRMLCNLEKRFKKKYVVLVHLHPNVACIKEGINYDKEVINSTFYPDTQELIACADILIGDYSSINYDFSLQVKPVFRYAMDLEEYQNDRDTYFSFNEYPYPFAISNDELEYIILNFKEEDYIRELNHFFNKLGSIREYGASKKVADIIDDVIYSKNKNKFFEKNESLLIWKEKK